MFKMTSGSVLFAKFKTISENRNAFDIENSTCNPNNTMVSPILIVSICMENPSKYKGLGHSSKRPELQ